MVPIRIKKDDESVLNALNESHNKNGYIIDLIRKDKQVYSLKTIKEIMMPIMAKHNIDEVYLFGSYARGEAKPESDIDIYCSKGDIETLIDESGLIIELEEALGKQVDIVFIGSKMGSTFEYELRKDLIKLCFPIEKEESLSRYLKEVEELKKELKQ